MTKEDIAEICATIVARNNEIYDLIQEKDDLGELVKMLFETIESYGLKGCLEFYTRRFWWMAEYVRENDYCEKKAMGAYDLLKSSLEGGKTMGWCCDNCGEDVKKGTEECPECGCPVFAVKPHIYISHARFNLLAHVKEVDNTAIEIMAEKCSITKLEASLVVNVIKGGSIPNIRINYEDVKM